ncbi:MAG: hypothetical protein H6581_27145 [Bacteroidia bacterium]|nr:hypothetical protein [Bacteroidia bacterium]
MNELAIQNYYEEELGLLFRALKVIRFRFIVIQHNHGSIRTEVRNLLKERFPQRSHFAYDMREVESLDFFREILAKGEGIFYLESFEAVFENHDLAYGFNQRRDRLSSHPIQLLAFLPPGPEPTLQCAKSMPDMWSLRNLVVDLEKEVEPVPRSLNPDSNANDLSSLGGHTMEEKIIELESLLERIDQNLQVNPVLSSYLIKQAINLVQDFRAKD